MKKVLVKIIAVFLFLAIGVTLGLAGHFYITEKSMEQVKKTESAEPYSYIPDNAGVLFKFDNDFVFIDLDFENEKISAVLPANISNQDDYCYGYKIDYRVSSDLFLVAGIIDLFGGIEITDESGSLRYTGVQVTDLLSTRTDNQAFKREIITALFNKISQVGISKSDFVYIIENSETDLTVPKCYYWDEKIGEMAKNAVLLN